MEEDSNIPCDKLLFTASGLTLNKTLISLWLSSSANLCKTEKVGKGGCCQGASY